jgi:hypothetical protein
MAQQVMVTLVDDLDGDEATETVQFGLDGVEYEIDLSDENASRLREAMADFVEKARRTGGRRQRNAAFKQTAGTTKGAHRNASENAAAIREWAAINGYEMSPRGRIPKHVVEAYHRSAA